MLTLDELEQMEKENRRIDRLLLQEYTSNFQTGFGCDSRYDSGYGKYSRAAHYCGRCLLEAINKCNP